MSSNQPSFTDTRVECTILVAAQTKGPDGHKLGVGIAAYNGKGPLEKLYPFFPYTELNKTISKPTDVIFNHENYRLFLIKEDGQERYEIVPR